MLKPSKGSRVHCIYSYIVDNCIHQERMLGRSEFFFFIYGQYYSLFYSLGKNLMIKKEKEKETNNDSHEKADSTWVVL